MKKAQNVTRKISPWFGLFGFLGFLGPVLYIWTKEYFPLVFLAFFGFFAFFFEGKMSNTLMDERFAYNQNKAVAMAGRISSTIMVFILIITVNWIVPNGIEVAFAFLVASLSLLWAAQMFLQVYLLYYFEHKE